MISHDVSSWFWHQMQGMRDYIVPSGPRADFWGSVFNLVGYQILIELCLILFINLNVIRVMVIDLIVLNQSFDLVE